MIPPKMILIDLKRQTVLFEVFVPAANSEKEHFIACQNN